MSGHPRYGYPSAIAYSDAEAVAAMVAFRAFGSDPHFVPAPFTSPTLATYRLVTTPVLEAGVYKVTLALLCTGSNGGTDIDMDVELDGVPLGVILSEANRVDGGFLLSVTVAQVWGAGTHTVEYKVAQGATSPGGSAVTAVLAFTTWVREA